MPSRSFADTGAATGAGAPPELLGRDAELRAVCDRLAANEPVVVLGEAGAGKSALLRTAATAGGRIVHPANGFATLSWLPFAPLARILGWPMRPGDAARIAAEIEMVVGTGILVLDDLHWCDRSTRSLVPLLAGRIGLLLAIRQRDPAADQVLAECRADGIHVLDLPPLPDQPAAELIRSLRPDLSPAAVVRLVRRTGGNPLLIRELAATGEPSDDLRRSVRSQLNALPAAAAELFAVLSLLGYPVPVDRLGPGAAALARAGLTRIEDGRVTPRHALLAEVAVTGLTAAQTKRLHERAAGITSDSGVAARHLLAAGRRQAARPLALAAARTAGSPAERASHLHVAAQCAGSGTAADQLRLDAATALSDVGEDAAAKAVLESVSGRDPQTRVRVTLLRTLVDWATGDGAGSGAALAELLPLLPSTSRQTAVAVWLAQARVAAFVDANYPAAADFARAALRLAQDHELSTARSRYLLGTALALQGTPGWTEQLAAAVTESGAESDHDVEFRSANNLIGAHEMTGDHAVAAELATRMVRRAHDLDLVAWERQFLAMRANLDMLAGRSAAALEHSDLLLAQALEPRTRDQVEITRTHALIDLGRFEPARLQIERSLQTAAVDALGRPQFLHLSAEIDFWNGHPGRAVRTWDGLLGTVPANSEIAVFAELGRARARAESGVDPGSIDDCPPITFFHAVPTEAAALQRLVAGELRAAADLFDRAAATWRPYHARNALYCSWQAGDCLRKTGDQESAAERLTGVETAAAASGMAPLLARARRSLRSMGLRRTGPTVGGRRTGEPVTGREKDVLDLVRAGLTNAEIAARLGLSRRTVETHLAAAGARLGARSRVQAAARYDDAR